MQLRIENNCKYIKEYLFLILYIHSFLLVIKKYDYGMTKTFLTLRNLLDYTNKFHTCKIGCFHVG